LSFTGFRAGPLDEQKLDCYRIKQDILMLKKLRSLKGLVRTTVAMSHNLNCKNQKENVILLVSTLTVVEIT